MRRYVLNTTASEAFYTRLQGIEVALRNALHTEATKLHGEEWYLPSVAVLQHPATEMVQSAHQSLVNDGKAPNPGRMLAELNFGFWVTILGPKYETSLWRPYLRRAFPNRPKGTERKDIQKTLNAIRRLRNRIAHHEPILERNLKSDYLAVIKVLGWICPDTATWVNHHSQTAGVIRKLNGQAAPISAALASAKPLDA